LYACDLLDEAESDAETSDFEYEDLAQMTGALSFALFMSEFHDGNGNLRLPTSASTSAPRQADDLDKDWEAASAELPTEEPAFASRSTGASCGMPRSPASGTHGSLCLTSVSTLPSIEDGAAIAEWHVRECRIKKTKSYPITVFKNAIGYRPVQATGEEHVKTFSL
jgi:hypothetical protein